jgi:hypothetical protein
VGDTLNMLPEESSSIVSPTRVRNLPMIAGTLRDAIAITTEY